MERQLVLALIVCAGLGCLAHTLWGSSGRAETSAHKVGIDDAFITYRYAQNLVLGHGLVFNRGERVEGFTNPAWVVVAAILYALLGADALHGGVVATTTILLLAGLAFLWRYGRRNLAAPTLLATLAGLALSPYVWAFASSGLETVAVTLAQLFLWFSLADLERHPGHRAARRAALAGCLLVALRADGLIAPAVAFACLVLRRRLRPYWADFALPIAGVTGSLFIARAIYYRAWLPNTFHAKVAATVEERLAAASSQLVDLSLGAGLGAALVTILVTAATLRRRATSGLAFPLAFAATLVLYWLWIGGDHFGERFLLFLYPVAAACVGHGLSVSPQGAIPRRLLMVWLVLLLALPIVVALRSDSRFRYSSDRYDAWTFLGRSLGERHPRAKIAVGAAGKVPYYSQLSALDMRGLTDRHIASRSTDEFVNPGHDKSDPDYVLSQRPLLIAGFVVNLELDLVLGLDAERYRSAGYRIRYLLNVGRHRRPDNIIDLVREPKSGAELEEALRSGYSYAVLERAAATRQEG